MNGAEPRKVRIVAFCRGLRQQIGILGRPRPFPLVDNESRFLGSCGDGIPPQRKNAIQDGTISIMSGFA